MIEGKSEEIQQPMKLVGIAACAGDVEGPAYWVSSGSRGGLIPGQFLLSPAQRATKAKDFPRGAVLISAMTSPDLLPAMRKASAIVTGLGGRTCHAAIVSRELRIPCVVGVGRGALEQFVKDGTMLRVKGAEGLVEILEG